VTFKSSLKVIGSHAIQQVICDSLFVFHCKYVFILHRWVRGHPRSSAT